MRRLLDILYDAAAWLAALFMVGTLAMVLAGILDRLFALAWRGTDMYAGYCMAASGFLALAHTLKRGEHIRVTLILNSVGMKTSRALETWSLSAAVLLAGAFAFYSVKLAYQSWDFHDVSTGYDATPLWIPQLSMATGTVVLFIAFLDEWWLELSGRRTTRYGDALLHNE